MIDVWRLVRRDVCASPSGAFDGHAAAIAGGRWNRAGTRAAYVSSTRALAMLELLAVIERIDAPRDYALAHASLDERDVAHVSVLPARWRDPMRCDATVEIGEAFIASGSALALAVPSAVVPQEFNYLINPRHPRFRSLRIAKGFEPALALSRVHTNGD